SAFCFLLSAFCFLLSAFCFLLSAFCFLLSASCFLLPASCFLLPVFYPLRLDKPAMTRLSNRPEIGHWLVMPGGGLGMGFLASAGHA
ncbi:hypothetical protein, partial [Aeromonas finlandensis]|uniref:hypothetical protein n=1 Tax=Aeromonas finlandensis TaxID=1543375 RepID=UPI0019D3C88D